MRGPCLLFRKSNVYTHDVAVLGNESSLWKHTGSLSSCFTIILFELSLIKKKECCQTWSPLNTAVPWGEPVSKEKMKIPSPEFKKMKHGFIVYPKFVGLLSSSQVLRWTGEASAHLWLDLGVNYKTHRHLGLLLYPHINFWMYLLRQIFFYRKYTHLKSVLSYTPIEQLRVSCACEECALCEVRGHSVLQKAPTCP